jgi:hypothetical protein
MLITLKRYADDIRQELRLKNRAMQPKAVRKLPVADKHVVDAKGEIRQRIRKVKIH